MSPRSTSLHYITLTLACQQRHRLAVKPKHTFRNIAKTESGRSTLRPHPRTHTITNPIQTYTQTHYIRETHKLLRILTPRMRSSIMIAGLVRAGRVNIQRFMDMLTLTMGSSRGLGWRIHGSVEDTKLSTNKQHSLSPQDMPTEQRISSPGILTGSHQQNWGFLWWWIKFTGTSTL